MAVAGPGSAHRLRTGLPGDVAFAVSVVCMQAWSTIIYGAVVLLGGGLIGSLGGSIGSDCSSWDTNCQSFAGSASDAANRVMFIGVVLLLIGCVLLFGAINMMRGNEGGRIICVITQGLIIAFGIWVAVETKSIIPAVVLGLFPLFALLGLVGKDATRLVRDSLTPVMVDGS